MQINLKYDRESYPFLKLIVLAYHFLRENVIIVVGGITNRDSFGLE